MGNQWHDSIAPVTQNRGQDSRQSHRGLLQTSHNCLTLHNDN